MIQMDSDMKLVPSLLLHHELLLLDVLDAFFDELITCCSWFAQPEVALVIFESFLVVL